MNVETSYYGVSVAGETRLVGSNSCHAVRAPRKAVNRSPFTVYRSPNTFAKIQHAVSEVRINFLNSLIISNKNFRCIYRVINKDWGVE